MAILRYNELAILLFTAVEDLFSSLKFPNNFCNRSYGFWLLQGKENLLVGETLLFHKNNPLTSITPKCKYSHYACAVVGEQISLMNL